jgi:D-alanyl-D-alanine carboxypeptidase
VLKGVKAALSANALKRTGPHIVIFSQKLLVVPAYALVLTAIAGLSLTALDVRPAQADALLLVDVDTGRVIDEQNSTYPWYPASVTKLMTAYVTFKALRDHRISVDTLFTVSPVAVAQQPSKMGFKSGTQITVDNALKMLLVHSANDMAVVLAEGVSGSIEKFADEMNAAAKRLGMTQTNYVNPNGLPADEQITSARDLAILARALIREFPEYDQYWHIASIRLGKRIYRNTNKLIDAYPGTDGMKTGFICASGFNLVATATRGDKRLVAVVLGATSSTGRAVKAAQLFERGFGADPLAWLMPSLGTVDSLVPIAAAPPNLHDDICVNNHRRHPTEEGEEGGEAGGATASGTDDPGQRSFLLSSLRGAMARGSAVLTSGLAAAIPPIDVYTGPARNIVALGAPVGAGPAAKKKPGSIAVAAKPPAAKPAQASTPPARSVSPANAAKPASPAGAAPAKPAKAAKGSDPWAGIEKGAPATPGPKTKPAVTASPKQPQTAPKTETQ